MLNSHDRGPSTDKRCILLPPTATVLHVGGRSSSDHCQLLVHEKGPDIPEERIPVILPRHYFDAVFIHDASILGCGVPLLLEYLSEDGCLLVPSSPQATALLAQYPEVFERIVDTAFGQEDITIAHRRHRGSHQAIPQQIPTSSETALALPKDWAYLVKRQQHDNVTLSQTLEDLEIQYKTLQQETERLRERYDETRAQNAVLAAHSETLAEDLQDASQRLAVIEASRGARFTRRYWHFMDHHPLGKLISRLRKNWRQAKEN